MIQNTIAIAAGMMIAASIVLFLEGCAINDHEASGFSSQARTCFGALVGVVFLMGTKSFLEEYEDLKLGVLGGADARKALLVFFVMTIHSFSEGVGVGVSFGGEHGSDLGVFISASLAVHNIPEGLAMAVVLMPRGISVLTAVIWAIATSLPQPIMAVPAYLFVHHFIPILPVGLGFAGGAMVWVALFELLVEAIEDTSVFATILVAIPSMATMLILQYAIASIS
jgi:zinc transporter, ZIP family